ncbi:winged helix-turn-helix transcriptional regulator [Nocardia sp. NPDC023852]|uniref:winged helix-turn-helix transcriptional regulator n=1 Tax=Nocardia sp. NPDC023852 TaxID=3154697 RepID=UPI003401C889
MLILRDLPLGATRFNDLARGPPDLSRSVLAKRLRQFERAGSRTRWAANTCCVLTQGGTAGGTDPQGAGVAVTINACAWHLPWCPELRRLCEPSSAGPTHDRHGGPGWADGVSTQRTVASLPTGNMVASFPTRLSQK